MRHVAPRQPGNSSSSLLRLTLSASSSWLAKSDRNEIPPSQNENNVDSTDTWLRINLVTGEFADTG